MHIDNYKLHINIYYFETRPYVAQVILTLAVQLGFSSNPDPLPSAGGLCAVCQDFHNFSSFKIHKDVWISWIFSLH